MTAFIAVPAAGASSRMRGTDKLLEPIDGVALLRRQVMTALACSSEVGVFLRPEDQPRRNALKGLDVDIHDVPTAALGLSSSLRMAASVCGEDQDLMVLLPDIPGVGPAEIRHVLSRFKANHRQRVVRATDPTGRPGTPIVFPCRLVSGFEHLMGDTGAKDLLRSEKVDLVVYPDTRATFDLDTPEDWAVYRSGSGSE